MSNLSIRAGGEPDQAFMNIEPTTQTAAALPFTLIDSHCHLHAEEYQGVVPQMLANAAQAGVRQIMTRLWARRRTWWSCSGSVA